VHVIEFASARPIDCFCRRHKKCLGGAESPGGAGDFSPKRQKPPLSGRDQEWQSKTEGLRVGIRSLWRERGRIQTPRSNCGSNRVHWPTFTRQRSLANVHWPTFSGQRSLANVHWQTTIPTPSERRARHQSRFWPVTPKLGTKAFAIGALEGVSRRFLAVLVGNRARAGRTPTTLA